MREPKGRILVVDDDRAMCEMLDRSLERHGFEVEYLTDPEMAVERLRTEEFDVLVTDLNMKGMGGLELCERSMAIRAALPVVVITAFGSLDTAIGAIRAGAYDFITKPFEIEVAALALERAVNYRRLRDDVKRLYEAASRAQGFAELIGSSPAMRRLYDLMDRIKDSDVTALVTGESGTGKELVARVLHDQGRRAQRPFIAVNCAALPEPLLESELFGHARGAFTDAKTERAGLFVHASGGTVLLDEICEMPLTMQAKLLRVLQSRTVRPVGSDREIPFDVRIIAATNRDLLAAIDEGRFRQDLYFRLNVLEIEVPSLRTRGNDVLLLAQNFIQRAAQRAGKQIRAIAPEAAQKLLDYRWPGNVRELQNCIERAVALARFDQITVDDLPDRIRDFRRSHVLVEADDPQQLVSLEEVEKRYILRVLEAVDNHRTAAAKILGLDRKTLYRKLEQWGYGKDNSES